MLPAFLCGEARRAHARRPRPIETEHPGRRGKRSRRDRPIIAPPARNPSASARGPFARRGGRLRPLRAAAVRPEAAAAARLRSRGRVCVRACSRRRGEPPPQWRADDWHGATLQEPMVGHRLGLALITGLQVRRGEGARAERGVLGGGRRSVRERGERGGRGRVEGGGDGRRQVSLCRGVMTQP